MCARAGAEDPPAHRRGLTELRSGLIALRADVAQLQSEIAEVRAGIDRLAADVAEAARTEADRVPDVKRGGINCDGPDGLGCDVPRMPMRLRLLASLRAPVDARGDRPRRLRRSWLLLVNARNELRAIIACSLVIGVLVGVALVLAIGCEPVSEQPPVWRWGHSVLDWRYHAVDIARDHPIGCYRARCGHLLMMVVELHARPYGKQCVGCHLEAS